MKRICPCFVPPEDEWAFDLLYCVAFVVMDKQWLDKNASYMDFNVIFLSMYMPYFLRNSSDCIVLTDLAILL